MSKLMNEYVIERRVEGKRESEREREREKLCLLLPTNTGERMMAREERGGLERRKDGERG